MDALTTAISGMQSEAVAAGVAMALIGVTLAVIALVRRKA